MARPAKDAKIKKRTTPASAFMPGPVSVEAGPVFISQRQIECLRLAALGFPDKAIARRLGITPRTVRSHMRQARLALGARDRTNAVVLALVKKLLSFDTLR